MSTNSTKNTVLLPEYLATLRELTLMDDALMTQFFNDIQSSQILISGILADKNIKVTDVTTQFNLKNLYGHSSRLDILATDEHGKNYNVEIQCSAEGAHIRRARYYSSLLDMHSLHEGDEYSKLPDNYVIFIVEQDIFKRCLPLYHIERIIKDENITCEDGSHIIYVNAKLLTKGFLGDIMHDMSCKKANDMRIPYFAKRMRYLKEETEGQIIMSDAMEKLAEKVAAKERFNRNVEIAQRLLSKNRMSYEDIADAT